MRHLRKARRHIHDSHKELPKGVRILAWARAVRWVGWGFGEALIPVFILAFSKTFAEAGLINSTVEIASLLALPVIGMWADRISAKKLILISLLFYPLVGVSYFFAGAFGLAIFVVIARVANGFTWELENIGIETYYRRTVDKSHVATSFGYVDTWAHVAWIGASLAGMVLVAFIPIYGLLFAIAPFSVIAYFLAVKAPADLPKGKDENSAKKSTFLGSYGSAIAEWRTWNRHLQLLSALVLLSSMVNSLMYFFLPIDAYLDGANLPMVVLITVFGSIPALFGYKLGKLADAGNKYSLISGGLVGIAAIAVGLIVFPQYWFKLVAIFLLGVILELFYVIESSLVTTLGPRETYGIRGSVFEGVVNFGDMSAPLILGVLFDVIGFSGTVGILAGGAMAFAFAYAYASRIRKNPAA
ncbi:MAG TPA: MFS transporter [Candidatus Paceibacterota bacterium]|nr:MFS transporter [Candidatus Paceibacterota bacterium]